MPSNVLPFFSPQAEQVLLDALSSQSQPECWAAVQCLALGGVCHDSVIRSLVSTLVEEGGDSSRTDKAIDLLAALSWRTVSRTFPSKFPLPHPSLPIYPS